MKYYNHFDLFIFEKEFEKILKNVNENVNEHSNSNIEIFLKKSLEKCKNNNSKFWSYVNKALNMSFNFNKKALASIIGIILTFAPIDKFFAEVEKLNLNKETKNEVLKILEEKDELNEEDYNYNYNFDVDVFLDKLAFKESSNNWTIVNKYGYIGKYQFGKIALLDIKKDLNVKYLNNLGGATKENIEKMISEFKKISNDENLSVQEKRKNLKKIFSEEEQDKAVLLLLNKNKKYLKKYKKFVGKKINNIEITWPGMLAAAHLKGAKSVKRYLDSNGKVIPKDKLGTSVEKYLKYFQDV